jgi:hypothetical protein
MRPISRSLKIAEAGMDVQVNGMWAQADGNIPLTGSSG